MDIGVLSSCTNATHGDNAMSDLAAKGSAVQVRLEGPLFIALETWRGSLPKIPPRSEALRMLIQHALSKMDKPEEVTRD